MVMSHGDYCEAEAEPDNLIPQCFSEEINSDINQCELLKSIT